MTDLMRVRTELTGFPGGPGVSTMYFTDVATAVASVRTFWNNLGGKMPSAVKTQTLNFGDVIDDASGEITGAWTADAATSTTGFSDAIYAKGVGVAVAWTTEAIVASKHVRGHTYVVPIGGDNYTTQGILTDSAKSVILGASNALIGEQLESFVIWSRPFAGKAAVGTRPARPARTGSHHLVTDCRVGNTLAILRTRRD